MSAISAEVKQVQEFAQDKQKPSETLVPNKWKGKIFRIHNDDFLTLHQALYNAAVTLDIEGVVELINAGADPNKATYGQKDPLNPPYPSFKKMIDEEEEDYPDYPMARRHCNAVTEVIRYEFFDPTKAGGTIIYGTKDREKETVLILLLKGGAIPSRCVSFTLLEFRSLLFSIWRYDNLSEIIMEEIRCISEAIYFEKTSDAGIQNLLLYEECANRASNFHTHFGVTQDLARGSEYLLSGSHARQRVAINEGILKKWKEKVLNPIVDRMKNAVKHRVFEPYTSIKSELGGKMPTDILCIIADYLETSLNSKFHDAFTLMHGLRFDAVEETPSKTLTLCWNKFHKRTGQDPLLKDKGDVKENGVKNAAQSMAV